MSKMLQDGQEILEGRFQIIKKLGSGAFGEIYKGKSACWCGSVYRGEGHFRNSDIGSFHVAEMSLHHDEALRISLA